MARRPAPVVARPPRLLLLIGAGLFVVMGTALVAVAVSTGAPLVGLNGVLPIVVGAVLAFVALRLRVRIDRTGIRVEGLGAAGRHVAWREVRRLEMTDVTPIRTGPRLVLKSGRSLPVPPSWRAEDGSRLPECTLAWARSMRVEVAGERATARRWPIAALILAGAMLGGLVALFG